MTDRFRSPKISFEGLLEAAPDAMVVVDEGGQIMIVNAQAERMFDYPRGELVGKPIEDLVPDRYRGGHLHHRRRFFETPSVRPMGAGLELHGQRRDGSEFPVEISLSPMQTDAGMVAIAAIRDITERREAQIRFRGLLESAPDAIVIVDSGARIVLVNAQAEKLFGYNRTELINEPIEKLVPERSRGKTRRAAGQLHQGSGRAADGCRPAAARPTQGRNAIPRGDQPEPNPNEGGHAGRQRHP